jgi:uncharacterized membrane protein YdjX (TVP38/TMEM64 family)
MTTDRTKPGTMTLRALLLLAIAALVLVYATGAYRLVSFELLLRHKDDLQAFVAARTGVASVIYVAGYVAVAALSIPGGAIMTLLGGFLFGWPLGTVLTVCGATLGASLLFLMARSALGPFLTAREAGRFQLLREGFNAGAVSYMLFLRLTPLVPFTVVNMGAAVLGVRFSTFVWTTLLGIIPATTVFSSIGAGLGAVLEQQRAALLACEAAGGAQCAVSFNPSALVTPEIVAGLCGLGVLALLPALIGLWQRRGQSRPAE